MNTDAELLKVIAGYSIGLEIGGPGVRQRLRNLWMYFTQKAKNVRGRTTVKLSLVVVFAALLVLVIYWNSASTPKIKVDGSRLYHEVKKGDFTKKFTQSGELRALNAARIIAPRDGTITYLVPEGTIVKAGDVLVRFDPSDYQRVLEENTAALRVAQADLRKAQKDLEVEREKQRSEQVRLKGEVEGLQLESDQMTRKMDLMRELVKKDFIARSTFEENELSYLKTKIKLEQARVALETAQRNVKPTLDAIQTAVERQEANVQRAEQVIANARKDLKDAEIRAPQAGLVVYAQIAGNSPEKIYEGLVTFRQRPLMYLPDVSKMVVDTEINEIDLREIKEGLPADIRLEAHPGEIFHGKVLKIGQLASRKRDPSGKLSRIKIFDVTVSIEEKDPRLKPGLTAAVDIIVDHQARIIAVPVAAVHSEKGEKFVFVSNKGKAEKRKIVLGPSNETSVVVIHGLSPGEFVIFDDAPSRS